MRFTACVVSIAALCLVAAVPAGAADYTAGKAVLASPASSPLLDPCPYQPDENAAQINYADTEVEPQVAVNPLDPQNVIGVFQEDRWSDGGAHGLLAAISMNGGGSYANDWAEFSSCSDKEETPYFEHLPRATDPWVSFDAAGRAYQVGLPIVDGSLTGESAVTVSTSADKGLSWSDPVDVTRDFDPNGLVFNDKQSITANPYVAGHAYVTWIQGNLPGENISFNKLAHAFSYRGQPMISRSTDSGAHWSAPQPMTNANLYAQGNQIVVLPNGTLLDVQAILYKGAGIQPNLNGVYMSVMRSNDDGVHWSSPSQLGKIGTVASSVDGQALRVGDYLPDIAVDRRSGNVYVTWADGMGGSTNKIVMSRSTDGGQHWSAPAIVSHHNSAQSFNHAITVANDGELVVMYYDTGRNVTGSRDGIPTDAYIRHSADAGRTWSTPQQIASFDFTNAPVARGHFVGDYQGLEAIGAKDLIAFFGVAGKQRDSAEVYSVRLSR
jgi:BNR repeat-like domain